MVVRVQIKTMSIHNRFDLERWRVSGETLAIPLAALIASGLLFSLFLLLLGKNTSFLAALLARESRGPQFARLGVTLGRATMAGWMIRLGGHELRKHQYARLGVRRREGCVVAGDDFL